MILNQWLIIATDVESDRCHSLTGLNIMISRMVFLIFHTAIIINRKNWRRTIKLTFLKKNEHTHMPGPPPLFVFVCFSMTSPFPPQQTYFLNHHLFIRRATFLFQCVYQVIK